MRILVCVKRVPLTGGKMVLTADEQALETRHLGFTISPHEECGVEEAVRLVEQHGGEVTRAGAGAARGRGADPRDAGDRRRPRRPAGHRRRGVGPAGHRGRDRRRGRRLRPDRVRQRVGRLGQLPGRHPGRARARPAGGDRAEGPVGRGRASALRAGGGRRARRLPRAAARGGDRARGHQPAALPVGAGEAAGAPEAGRDAARPSGPSRGWRGCGWWCRPARASRPRSSARGRRRRRPWST